VLRLVISIGCDKYQECEWGYINIEEVISVGAEMDLYFEDMMIDPRGNLINNKEVA